ncbi:glyoxalase [Streptomyces pilosus]|uniref:VOC family protein n=1 Tax=Streptomyces pilosus TaxID=28893 RepID=UPI001679CC46|nr:VOC family protein [Streptomyces pilosus]GGV45920.1 glyoxalase [Streptomyces pilosus]
MPSVNHVGITVSDLDRSLDFYTRLLGGEHVGSWERSGPRIDAVTGYPGVVVRQAFIRLLEGAALIELLQYVGGSGQRVEPDHGHVGVAHVAVDVTGLDALLARLRGEDVTVLSEPIVASEGPLEGHRVVYVLDPDRVRVELVEAPHQTGAGSGTERPARNREIA